MKKRLLYLLLVFSLLVGCESTGTGIDSAYILDREVLKRIDESVFEVVVPKPSKDSLSYEEPLPLDLIPFQRRSDPYDSIGTAFAVSDNLFLSAAHVLDLEYNNKISKMYLRDKDGNVFEIDEIHRYSNHVDFVSFSAKGLQVDRVLKVKEDFSLNQKVFAVGNALGDGIIIREGTLTSTTKEDEAGEWDWLRFSAPASPGNSGGPLLDTHGNVIGLVTMASENENLNYAVPMSVINQREDSKAVLHDRISYFFPFTYRQKRVIYDYETPLPKSCSDLKQELVAGYERFLDKTLFAFIDENRQEFFPHGRGSSEILHRTYSSFFPDLVSEDETRSWGLFYPSELYDSYQEHEGYIQYGDMSEITFVEVRKPDDISLRELYGRPRLLMDFVLKGWPVYRDVMNKQIRITSFGEPSESFQHSDNYGRKWLVSMWFIEYDRSTLIVFSLPVPKGTISLIVRQYNTWPYTISDLKVTTDFVHATYWGEFAEWTEFLELKDYLPDSFGQLRFSYIEGQEAHFSSNRLKISYDERLFSVSAQSTLYLYTTFFRDSGEVIWDIGSVEIGEHAYKENYFEATRELKPDSDLGEYYLADWNDLCKQTHPYDGTTYFEDGSTVMKSVHSTYGELRDREIEDISGDFIYSLMLNIDGKADEDMMKSKMNLVDSAVTILED